MGAMSGVTPSLDVRSGLSFLDSYWFPTSVESLTPVLRDTPSPRPPTHATTMLARGVNPLLQWICAVPAIAFDSVLGPVCMWIYHMYVSANSLPCSRVPVSLARPSLTLSQSEFESLYMRALSPTHIPVGFVLNSLVLFKLLNWTFPGLDNQPDP